MKTDEPHGTSRQPSPNGTTRRQFMEGAAVAALAVALAPRPAAAQPSALAATGTPSLIPAEARVPMTFRINARPVAATLDPRTTLLDALREEIGLNGSKKGCDHGQCGACTILVNGRRINACLTLAIMHQD